MSSSKRRNRSVSRGLGLRQFGFEPLEMRAVPATAAGKVFHDWNGNGLLGSVGEPGLAGRQAFVDINGNGTFDGASGGTSFGSGILNIPIPTTITTITNDMVIAGSGLGAVTDVNVRINITHTFDADLDIFLIYDPAGTPVTIELTTDNGGSGDNYANTIFDDEAGTAITAGAAPFAGTFRPEGLLSGFDGLSVDGTWQLRVGDDASGDGGNIIDWELIFNGAPPEPTATTNATGDFTVTGVPIGTYNLRITPVAGWGFTSGGVQSITVAAAGDALTGLNAGAAQLDAIYGTVVEDNNGNLAYDQATDPRLAGRTVFLDANNNGTFDGETGGTDFTTGVINVPIADVAVTTSDLDLTGSGFGVLTDVNVFLDLTHTFDADLDIFLIYDPFGANISVELSTDNGSSGDNYTSTVFTDEAGTAITAGVAPFTGSFRPEGLLSAFDSLPGNVLWRLSITDDLSGDFGNLIEWKLSFNNSAPEVSTITDASGNFLFAGVAAGVHNVRHTPGAGFTTVFPATNLYTVNHVLGTTNFGNDFGEIVVNTINGNVYNDLDNNGARNGLEAGIADRIVYLDGNGNDVWDVSPYTAYPNLYLADSPAVTTSPIMTVTGGPASIADLNLMIHVGHSFTGDLEIRLIHDPNGTPTSVLLSDNVGGGGDNFLFTTFDDEAATAIAAGVAPFFGSFIPTNALSAFDGLNANADWAISFTDTAGGDVGELFSWSLLFDGATPETFTRTDASGNFKFTGLAPASYTTRMAPAAGWSQTQPAANGEYSGTLTGANSLFGQNFGSFASGAPSALYVVAITPDPRTTAVSTVDFVLEYDVALASLDFNDLTLTRNGSPVALTNAVTFSKQGGIGNVYRASGLAAFTGADGVYVITLNMAGTNRLASVSDEFEVQLVGPTVVDVVDVAPDPRGTAVSTVDVTFDGAIDLASVEFGTTGTDAIRLNLDGNPVTFSGNETITRIGSTYTYTIAGLAEETGTDGSYELIVDAANLTDNFANAGSGSGNDLWVKQPGDAIAPTVTGIFFAGSTWGTPFRTAAGDASFGFPGQTGANQLLSLPWNNLNEIVVTFSEPVAAPAGLLSGQVGVRGANGGTYAITSVTAVSASTWRILLTTAPDTDWLIVDLDGDGGGGATRIEDLAGNDLAGTFTESVSTFPTAGAAGVDFKYRFKVVVGDQGRNGTVRNVDLNAVRNNLFIDIGAGGYDIFTDIDANGLLRNADLNAVRNHLFIDAPAVGPTRPNGGGARARGTVGAGGSNRQFTSTPSVIERTVEATRRIGATNRVADALDQLFAEI